MAAAEPIAISSSPSHCFGPTTPPRLSQPTLSSSPGLPSLSKLVGGILQPTRRRAIYSEASPRFTGAKSVPQPANSTEQNFTHSSNEAPFSEAKNSLQSPAAKTAMTGAEKIRKESEKSDKPNARRKNAVSSKTKKSSDTAVAVGAGSVESGDVCVENKQPKKPKKNDQTKLKKAKVTKPGSRSITSKRPKKTFVEDLLGTASNECEIDANVLESKTSPVLYNESGLGLVEAVKRRRDWTPAKHMSEDHELSNETEGAWSALIPCGSPSLVRHMDESDFAKRLGEFGFANSGPQAVSLVLPASRDSHGEAAATKKRKLDLVTGIASSKSKMVPVKRSRSPKKKPQTITDKATAPFLLDNQASTSTLLDYFPSPHQSTVIGTDLPLQQPITNSEHGETRQKHPGKTKAAKPKAKKVKELVVLHPPELAVKVANEQDLLFGTSSQLARDESPTFIRDLQRAVKESEADNPQLVPLGNDSQLSAQSIASTFSNSRLPIAARNLWSTAARDDAGRLLDVDVVDLVDTPKNPHSFSSNIDSNDVGRAISITPAAGHSHIAVSLGSCKDVDSTTGVQPINPPGLDHQKAENLLPRSVAESSLRERPKSKSPVKKSAEPSKDQKASATQGGSFSEMPNYNALNDIELKKAVTATGFKNIRKRADKITHLQNCWDEKQRRRALQSLPPNTSAPLNPAKCLEEGVNNSPKRRGRPPKFLSAIDDTEDAKALNAASPKKPRGRPKKIARAGSSKEDPKALALGMSETGHVSPVSSPARRGAALKVSRPRKVTGSSAVTENTEKMAALFPIITKAVTSYPPTHDLQNLTWFEKMLLYDPIVLEDLTEWLNSQGLSRVGCGETVDPIVAKLWCESQSKHA
ncbi:MAG: hypothetical protein Q9224_002757 [Gallowayella concinna]